VVEEARTFYTLEAADIPFSLACDPSKFSAFVPFLMREPYLYKFELQVEVLAYNPGVLGLYGEQVHPKSGGSMVLVPTIVLSKDDRSNEQIADWLRKFNEGDLSWRLWNREVK
jgi:hypothetical protein